MKGEKTMDKPLSLVIEDAKELIVNAVNDTNLPAVLLEPILKDIYNEIQQLKINQYMSDKSEYERSLQKEQTKQCKQDLESVE